MSSKRKRKTPKSNKRNCKCIIHDQICDDEEPERVYTIASRDCDRVSLEVLYSLNVLSNRAQYVCNKCLEHGAKKQTSVISGDSSSSGSDDDSPMDIVEPPVVTSDAQDENDDTEILDLIESVIIKLSTVQVTQQVNDKLNGLLFTIGNKIIKPALVNVDHLRKQYLSTANLKQLNSLTFLNDCNQMLVNFVSSITGRSIERMEDEQLYRFASCIESIYHLKNSNLILPHSFLSNLIMTTTSGSKTVTEVNAKTSPGASDTTYRKWIASQGQEELKSPAGNLDVYIDNIGKYKVPSFRVQTDNNRTPTVITAILNIPLKSTLELMNIQYKSELQPSAWRPNESEKKLQDKMEMLLSKAEQDFRVYRAKYLDEIINYMYSSQDMNMLIDDELKKLSESQYTRKCDACGTLHLPRKQKCQCGGRVSSITQNTTTKVKCTQEFPKYIHIGEILNYNPAATSVNEPSMFNPNSKESLKNILQHLKKILIDNGDGRKWVFVGADGPPYTILRRIIDDEPTVYDWVILVSGKGHLNMNQLKTFFKVLDHVCGDVLGNDVLQFNTPKSYKYFIDCKDNHKTWQALEIFLHGSVMEIIQLYASKLPAGVTPGVMGFLDWQSSTGLSPTLQFMTQFTLNFALAIYVQRIGDRNNDEKCSDAGRYKFNDMFYAFNHPIYREVEYNELRQRISFPSEIVQLRTENITYSNVGGVTRNNHEGGDFKLENQIKRIKSLAPKGRISEDIWN